MTGLTLLLLLTAALHRVDYPRTYLASIVDVPLKADERIESFSIATWGVRFNAVCHIAGGWLIKAGGSATPEGVLKGEGGQGATWLFGSNPKKLRQLVLLTLYDVVQRHDIRIPNGEIPATFEGHATISNDTGERKVRLNYRNVRLVPARRCPAS